MSSAPEANPRSVPRGGSRSRAPRSRSPTAPTSTLKSELLEDLRRRSPKVDLAQVSEAFDYSRAAHGDQRRESGEPYVSHPVAVHILLDLLESRLDTALACAALLHDVVEDTRSRSRTSRSASARRSRGWSRA